MIRRFMLTVGIILIAQIGRAQIIDTVAGGGPDNLPALSANLDIPVGVEVDAAGNYYIAGFNQHRVFKVDGAGQLTVVAGTGLSGFSGDGGPATSASLRSPQGVALDSAGNLYIADTGNQRIRRVDAATGIITTVAGNGFIGFSGDGGLATNASFGRAPVDVILDSADNLFITEPGNGSGFSGGNRIRRVDAATGIITTVAGNGILDSTGDGGLATSASLMNPQSVALDSANNLFIAELGVRGNVSRTGHTVRRVDAVTGIITTVAGTGTSNFTFSADGGLATNTPLAWPISVAVDSLGNLFIGELITNRVRRVDGITGIITTVAGNGISGFSGDGGPATNASLGADDVALDGSGNLFIADQANQRIRLVDGITGIITTVAGNGITGFSGEGVPATSAMIRSPRGVALDGSGNLFIVDGDNHRIRKVSPGGIITTVAGNGILGFSGDGGPATSASFKGTSGVALDGSGNLFIVDRGNQRVRKVSPGGIITTVAGNGIAGFSGDGGPAIDAGLGSPSRVTLDGTNNLYIADTGNQRIRRVDGITGIITTVAGNGIAGFSGDGGPATSASLQSPTGVVVDGAGNLFLSTGVRVRKVSASGIITTVAGDGNFGFSGDGGPATSARLQSPLGVALDSAGNLYIADPGNQRIRRVNATTGIITTVAGDGSFGFSGDGGPATSASLASPFDVAVDGAGNLFIADAFNDRIRRVEPPVNITPTVAADNISVAVNEGATAANTGTFDDADTGDDVAITASVGTVTKAGTNSGTWSWSFGTADGLAESQVVTITADDDNGGVSEATFSLNVSNIAPTGTFNSPASVIEGNPFNLSITAVTDPSPVDTTAAFEFAFDCGDGLGLSSFGSSNSLSCPTTVPETRNVKGRVRDKDGGFGEFTATVDVLPTNQPSTVAADNASVAANEGATAANTGIYDDANASDDVVITASVGTVIKTGTNTGTWAWSFGTTNGPDESQLVTITADDGNGGITSITFGFTVNNVPPTVSLSGPNSANEADTNSYSFTVADPGNDLFSVQAGFPDCGAGGSLTGSPTITPSGGSFQCIFADGPAGPNVTVQVADSDGASAGAALSVIVNNVAPDGILVGPASVNEGDNYNLSLTSVTDPSSVDTAAGFQFAFDCGGGAGLSIFNPVNSVACPAADDNGVRNVSGHVTDKDGGVSNRLGNIQIVNVAPTITNVSGPSGPLQLGPAANIVVDYDDPGLGDTHQCLFSWDDDPTNPSTTTIAGSGSGSGQCTGTFTYAAAGVFTVSVTVSDDDGGSDSSEFQFVVVFDPDGGFVTGGGWIQSDAGFCSLDALCAAAEGKANFGFVSKYRRGATIPTGQTEFQFKAGDLNFHSTAYEWLVVAGARAQFKGTGTINGAGNYNFMLTAIDGALPGGGGADKFRIKITGPGGIVYDNQPRGGDNDDPTTTLGGGSIVIHK